MQELILNSKQKIRELFSNIKINILKISKRKDIKVMTSFLWIPFFIIYISFKYIKQVPSIYKGKTSAWAYLTLPLTFCLLPLSFLLMGLEVYFRHYKFSSNKSKLMIKSTAILSISLFGMVALLIFFDQLGGFDIYAIMHYRLPKIPMMIIMGAGVALSTLLLQKVTKNKMIDIGLIGASDLGLTVMAIFSITAPSLIDYEHNTLVFSLVIPLVIGISAFVTLALLYVMSYKRGVSPRRVILMGIGFHVFFTGLATLIIYLNNGYDMNFFSRYLTGFIEKKKMMLWIISLSVLLVVAICGWLLGKQIDILENDELSAKSVGIKTELLKFMVFTLVALAVGVTVSLVGSVALLGIFVPNIARSLYGNKTRVLIPACMVIGTVIVMVAQFVNINWLHIGAPTGIVLQLVCAPYFLYRIFKKGL